MPVEDWVRKQYAEIWSSTLTHVLGWDENRVNDWIKINLAMDLFSHWVPEEDLAYAVGREMIGDDYMDHFDCIKEIFNSLKDAKLPLATPDAWAQLKVELTLIVQKHKPPS